ncbi:twin-arginine translocation signal domain-containing protein [Mesorhizobium sp. ASY16-5R]
MISNGSNISRRDFLRTSGAVAAGTAAISSLTSAAGRERRP